MNTIVENAFALFSRWKKPTRKHKAVFAFFRRCATLKSLSVNFKNMKIPNRVPKPTTTRKCTNNAEDLCGKRPRNFIITKITNQSETERMLIYNEPCNQTKLQKNSHNCDTQIELWKPIHIFPCFVAFSRSEICILSAHAKRQRDSQKRTVWWYSRQSQFNKTETKLSDLYMQNVDFSALAFAANESREENVSSKFQLSETVNNVLSICHLVCSAHSANKSLNGFFAAHFS